MVKALRDLGVPALRNAIKEMGDAGASMLGPIRIAGCGVEVDVTLPSGVSTIEVQNRRRKLAENLTRHEHEVFITIPPAACTVRLWVADSGALDEPIGPSPLVTDETMTADYKKGKAPWGGRLHDARHTAATVLMLLGVPARVIDQIMGWEPGTSASMRARYLHVPDAMLKDVARKIVEAIWGAPETPAVDKNQDNGV